MTRPMNRAAPPPILEHTRGVILGVSSPDSVGFRCAAAFRQLGATLGITYRPARRAEGALMAQQLGCAHATLEATDEGSFAQAFEELGAKLGHLDFLVHTWVHVPEGALERPIYEIGAQEFADVMEVGVRSLLVACRYALPLLSRSIHPRIVTLLSPGADLVLPRYHAVGMAKGALAAAVGYLAHELGPRGILCNAVSCSILDTAGARRVVGAATVAQTRAYLARRSMTQTALGFEHVAGAVAFLASPLCRNITGETLTVDGGFSRSYF
jgi:enoyl-[acyl-carrier protein] reductase I